MKYIASLVTLCVVMSSLSAAFADDTSKSYEQSVARAINYLKLAQKDNGSFDPKRGDTEGVGITALVTTAILRHGRTPQDPMVAKSLSRIEEHVQADGGIYSKGSTHRNYETCLSILCLKEANQEGNYDKIIANADKFVKGIQWDASEDKAIDESHESYGGAGYGSHGRPDLSNTSFLIEALKAAGNDSDSEAMQRALVFVSRCQNLESEHNTTKFASKVNDGGFYYTIAAGGSSQAGPTEDGGLRSYASMTYAGLKSMIYAGVDKEDPRVKAAVSWIGKHYDLDVNAGMGDADPAMKTAGLYYYYHTFAKALHAFGEDEITTADGKTHDWRKDLIAELVSRQQKDGSWINTENNRWSEGDGALVTGYALLALSYCDK